jgi:hypothetical protein
VSLPVAGNTNILAPQKEKRRRPKKKNRNSKSDGPATDKPEGGDGRVYMQDSSAVQKGGRYNGKGTVGEDEVIKLTPAELVVAMEVSRLWKGRSERGM